jgi:hypothetical protein
VTGARGAGRQDGTPAAFRARVAGLYARLEQVVASWDGAIAAPRASPATSPPLARRTPEEVLALLESELDEIERQCAEQRRVAEADVAAVRDWEERFRIAADRGDAVLAAEAVRRQRELMATAELSADALAAIGAARDSHRNAIAAVREHR